MNHPPILIHLTELGDRIAVWYSSDHPNDSIAKQGLREFGYSIETLGDVYTIADPVREYNNLGRVKIAIEALYGVSEADRSVPPS